MRFLTSSVVAAAITLASAASAMADKVTVAAGKTSPIGFYYTYARDTCHYGNKPKVVITQQPEHGTLQHMWKPFRMGPESRNCKGKQVYGTLLLYTPHKGYRGTDVVKFTLSGSGVYPGASYGIGRGFRTDINVK